MDQSEIDAAVQLVAEFGRPVSSGEIAERYPGGPKLYPWVYRRLIHAKRAGRVAQDEKGRWVIPWVMPMAASPKGFRACSEPPTREALPTLHLDVVPPWTGPGPYGFDLVSPEGLRWPFGEVDVDAEGVARMTGVDVSENDATVLREVVDGLVEIFATESNGETSESTSTTSSRELVEEHAPRLCCTLVSSIRDLIAKG